MSRKSHAPTINRRASTKEESHALERLRSLSSQSKTAPSSTGSADSQSFIPLATGSPSSALIRRAAHAAQRQARAGDPRYAPKTTDVGDVVIPLDDEPHLKARISRRDYERLTSREGPNLTRARWWRDADGMVRAYSRKDRGAQAQDGLLVAALLSRANDGDLLEMEDPLNLSRRTIHLIALERQARFA